MDGQGKEGVVCGAWLKEWPLVVVLWCWRVMVCGGVPGVCQEERSGWWSCVTPSVECSYTGGGVDLHTQLATSSFSSAYAVCHLCI